MPSLFSASACALPAAERRRAAGRHLAGFDRQRHRHRRREARAVRRDGIYRAHAGEARRQRGRRASTGRSANRCSVLSRSSSVGTRPTSSASRSSDIPAPASGKPRACAINITSSAWPPPGVAGGRRSSRRLGAARADQHGARAHSGSRQGQGRGAARSVAGAASGRGRTERQGPEKCYLGSSFECTFATEVGAIFVVAPDLAWPWQPGDVVSLRLAGHGLSVVAA